MKSQQVQRPGPVRISIETGRSTMSTKSVSEVIDQDRRQLLSNAAMGIAAAGAASIFPAFKSYAAASAEIRPFRVHFPEEALVDLRRRVSAAKWPSREIVRDATQGVQ